MLGKWPLYLLLYAVLARIPQLAFMHGYVIKNDEHPNSFDIKFIDGEQDELCLIGMPEDDIIYTKY